MRYAIAVDVLAARLDGEVVLLHLQTKRYFRLNASAAVVWDALAGGATRPELIEALLAEYDVERAEAERAVDGLVAALAERTLVITA